MKRFNHRLLWGIVLVIAGVLFLVENLGILPYGGTDVVRGAIWAVLCALSGAAFMGAFLQNRTQWWTLFPGLTLLGVAGVIALSVVAPSVAGAWIGAGFLVLVAIAFWTVYYLNRSYWWAIIPAGVLTTLAVVSGSTPWLSGIASGGLFFLGLGLTFAMVGTVKTSVGRMQWAFIPAGILFLMGVLVTLSATSLANYVVPVVLVCLGAYFVWRALFAGNTGEILK